MNNREFINSIIKDSDVDDKTANFLLKYLSSWLNDTGIDINVESIKMLKDNEELIDQLKILYSKEKILNTIERKIILSDIAKGKLVIEQARNTREGTTYVKVEPTFAERIQAINALNALDSIINNDESPNIKITLDWNRNEEQ